MKIWTKALLLLMLLLVQNAAAWADSSSKITVGNPKNPVGQADALAPYILQSSWTPSDPVPPMPNQRVLAVSAPLALTDGGAGSTLTLSLTTPFTIAQGGTGQTTREAALDALMAFASVGAGDIAYYNGTHWVRLASGNGYLNNAGGTLSWLAATGAAEDEPYVTTSSSGNLTNESVLATANSDHLTLTGATFDIGTDVVTLNGSQTLTSKELTSPRIGTSLIFEEGANDLSITATTPSAARAYNFPDVGSNVDIVLCAGAQTLAGVKTFSSAPVLSTGTITANGDTLTLPDLGSTSFAYIAGAQTLTDKTLTAPIFGTNFTLDNGSNDGTITWDAFSAARAYVIKDVGADAHFVMKSTGSSYTAGAVPYGDGSKLLFTAQGSSGQALISAGASAPAFGTLGLAGGGTNITSYTAGDLLVVNDSGALVKLPLGSNGEVLSVNTSNNPKFDWIAAGGSGTVTSFSAGDLSPLFTTSEATATTTPALTFSLSNAAAYTVFGNNTGSTAAPAYQTLSPGQLIGAASRSLPTSGTITSGTYIHIGNWSSSATGGTFESGCRIIVIGTFTIDDTGWTVAPCTAQAVGSAAGGHPTLVGPGLGGGMSSASSGWGGAGGGFGGNGGSGATIAAANRPGGRAYSLNEQMSGSGGGGTASSTATGASGGFGGGGFYLYATGAVTFTEGLTATGGAGDNGGATISGGGGGGSGGGIDIASLTSITVAGSKVVSCIGGAGGNDVGASGGGGGGGGGRIRFTSPSNTVTGSLTVTGGAGGTGDTNGGSGSTGTTETITATPLPFRIGALPGNNVVPFKRNYQERMIA